MRFDEIQAFLAVLDHGSFLSAAVVLGVSRTTLRRQVEALEARLGTPLFARSAAGVVLTDAGKKLERGARGLERDYRGLLDQIRDENQQPSGELRIILPAGPPPHVVTAGLSFLRAMFPGVRLHVRICEAPLAVEPSEADVFVYLGKSAPAGAWRTEVLTAARQYLVASRAYLEERGTPATFDALRGHELLVWHPPGAPEASWLPLPGIEWKPTIAIASTDAHLIHELAVAGRGIAYFPLPELPFDTGAEPLVPVLADFAGAELALRVSVASHLARVPKIASVLDHVRDMWQLAREAKSSAR